MPFPAFPLFPGEAVYPETGPARPHPPRPIWVPTPPRRWRLVATTLNGTPIGELLNASQRRVSLGLNRTPTCDFRLRLDDPLADALLECSALIKVYDNRTLRFVGQVITAVEEGGQSIAITCAGPAWRLSKRLIGKGTTGYTQGTADAPVAAGQIMASILAAVNTDGYTGIDLGMVGDSSSTYVAYEPYKRASEAFTEISSVIDGPDYELAPVEPTAVAGGTRIAYLNVAAAIGQARPDAIFEYAVGRKNVASYTRQVSMEGFMNAGYGLAADAAGTTVGALDAGSQAAWGLYEDVVPSDLPVQLLRQRLVDEHVRVRKAPRQLITFAPTRDDPSMPGRVPLFGEDYGVGDSVTFRAVDPKSGSVRVNAAFRVYAIEFAIDEQGATVPTLTLSLD